MDIITTTTAFQAPDGSLHHSREAAEKYDLRKKIIDLVERKITEQRAMFGVYSSRGLQGYEVASLVMDNLEIFYGYDSSKWTGLTK